MKRLFDFLLALILGILLFFPFIFLLVIVRLSSEGPAIFWSERIGVGGKVFLMPKLRTMYSDTPNVASHLLNLSGGYITPIGKFLRKYSVDEIPQIWTVLIGKMSFVGPRPALFNQYDLIELRHKRGIDNIKPGITGLAQVNGRDEISIEEKVDFDYKYLLEQSFMLDLRILFRTIFKVIKKDGLSH